MPDTAERREPVSRRRLFGLLGGAAAVGTGLAVAGSTLAADPAGATAVTAGATDGDALQIGGSNTCVDETLLTASVNAFSAEATGANGNGLRGTCNAGAFGRGVIGLSATGTGVYASGRVPLQLVPGGTSGPPTTGNTARGSFFVDVNGVLFYCVADGTPGTWVRQSPLVTIPPARVYDSRVGQSPATLPKSPIVNGGTVTVDVTGPRAGGGNSGVPASALSVLGNVTVVNGVNPGVFLTIYAAGALTPATSSVNASSGGIVANNFTSQLGAGGGNANKIAITCGGGPTDFVIDILGYYP